MSEPRKVRDAGDRARAMEIYTTVAAEAQTNDITWLATMAHQQLAATDAMLGRGRSVAEHLALFDPATPVARHLVKKF